MEKKKNIKESYVILVEDGWPLGLQPVNVRAALARTRDFSGSISFNTLLTGSPSSSTDSSSDLDTESTGSFFHDKSITLGSLIGVSSIIELSGRSVRGRKSEIRSSKKNHRSRTWLFSLCSRDSTDAQSVTNPPSLGHFLAVERRAANDYRRSQSPIIYGPDELALARPVLQSNSLFIDDRIAPPQVRPWPASEIEGRQDSEHGNGYAIPVLFSCMCGQSTH
ncbi:hypothetical protein RJ641_032905 [Dillenia turbinata]|uniref:Uncharacterized protein n=1 Tax=Dillenia turbinata TaxID=194707 RepID=A0AAN8VKJ4_9MAGN